LIKVRKPIVKEISRRSLQSGPLAKQGDVEYSST